MYDERKFWLENKNQCEFAEWKENYLKNIIADPEYRHPTSDSLNYLSYCMRDSYDSYIHRFGQKNYNNMLKKLKRGVKTAKLAWGDYVVYYLETHEHPDNQYCNFCTIFFDEHPERHQYLRIT